MTFPVVGSNIPSTYQISNSLRFNDGDSPTLSRTPGSAGNRKTWTFSYWIKRSTISTVQQTFAVGTNAATPWFLNYINSDDTLHVWFHDGTNSYFSTGLNKLRDTSAWYHIVYFVDTTQATASDRFKVYVNNVEVTWGSYNPPAQNFDTEVNTTSTHYIGRAGNGQYFDGYIAETYFIDGQALTPSNFGEFDEDSGVWKPKQYAGTYGTNGFYLKFNNTGNMGEDSSGNDNTFTPVNLSGTTDVTTDTPTNNFATLNPLQRSSTSAVLSEGNCKLTNNTTSNPWQSSYSTIGMNTGKWYWEYKVDSQNASIDPAYGIVADSNTQYQDNTYGNLLGQQDSTASSYGISFYGGSGEVYYSYNGGFGQTSAFGGHSVGDIIGVAVDFDNDAIYFSVNGTYVNSGDPTSGASRTGAVITGFANNQTWFAQGQCYTSNDSISANFGNAPFSISSGNSDGNGYGNFEYAPPSGYLALCTQNLATALSPTINDGSQYFNTVLYTGNGSTNAITGVGFQPDWVWGKCRSAAQHHRLFDSSRGVLKNLISSATNAEATTANSLTSFDSDGFTLGSDDNLNFNTRTFVAWNWKANAGTTSSNTDGSITSTVQANTTAGFSIVTFTGTGLDATVGHGLNVAPDMVIVKSRDAARNWPVYHRSLGGDDSLKLNLTDATTTSLDCWNDLDPTSTVVHLGTTGGSNVSGENAIMYCFHSVEGYSKFGSYTGNGNADGTFVYTGFRPALIIGKNTTFAGPEWFIFDSKISPYNVIDIYLYASNNPAESGGTNRVDFLSNGFKWRNTALAWNGAHTYIYMAFAENPFVTSGATPVTAR